MAKTSPFDFLNSINYNKNDMREDPQVMKDYNSWMVNRGLSYFHDTIEHANEMNMMYELDGDLQYAYLINIVRPRKRFSKWHKSKKDSDLEAVMKIYGYSIQKAKEALSILTEAQLEIIRKRNDEGST